MANRRSVKSRLGSQINAVFRPDFRPDFLAICRQELLKFVERMQEEEERHIRENLTEEELELFDLLKKDKLTKAEEQQVRPLCQKAVRDFD